MASEAAIKAAIERKVGGTLYSIWTIGVTDDPARRKREHTNDGKNTNYWSHWDADSETIARNVERYFLGRGMKGGGGGGGQADYVYVF